MLLNVTTRPDISPILVQVEVLDLGVDGVPTPLRICKPRFINSMPEVVSEELVLAGAGFAMTVFC